MSQQWTYGFLTKYWIFLRAVACTSPRLHKTMDEYNNEFNICKCYNDNQPLAIFWPISAFGWEKFNLVRQIYCTFPVRKATIPNSNVSTFNGHAINYYSLFQTLVLYTGDYTLGNLSMKSCHSYHK